MIPPKKNFIFNLAIIVGFILPHSNTVFLVIHASLPLVLMLLLTKGKAKNKYSILFAFYVFLVFVFNTFTGEIQIGDKDLSRLAQFSLLFFLFPFVENQAIDKRVLYFLFSFLIISQVVYVYNYSPLVSVLNRVYFSGGEMINGIAFERYERAAGDLSMVLKMRYGGIYGNPNQYAKYLTLLYVVFLIEVRCLKKKGGGVIVSLLVLGSMLFTGSRTGLVSFLIVTGIYWVIRLQARKNNMLLIGLSVLFLFIVVAILPSIALDFRGFDVVSGFGNSFFPKVGFLSEALSEIDFLHLLFGNFTSSGVSQVSDVNILDSEWGELLFSFGVIGVCFFLFVLLGLLGHKDRQLSFYLLILLWGLTSTIIFSFRMSFLFMLFLSKYYSDYKAQLNSIRYEK